MLLYFEKEFCMKKTLPQIVLKAFIFIVVLFINCCFKNSGSPATLSDDEVRMIAKESYIALFPLVYNYGTMHSQVIDKTGKDFIGGFGQFKHYGLASPNDKGIPTPNNNTPYSWAWLDLRAEPWVLTMPPVEKDRYYVSQWDDMWGYVIDAPGSIIDGNQGGDYLIATVNFQDKVPKNIKRVIYSESEFVGTLTRTGIKDETDLARLTKIQKGYKLRPLSEYLGLESQKKPEKIQWLSYSPDHLKTIDFFKYANFLLTHTIPNNLDKKMLEKAAKIGIAAGKPWPVSDMSQSKANSIQSGISDALKEIKTQSMAIKDGKKLFNTRKVIGQDYLNRTVGVVVGQFGNYPNQAMYPGYQKDSSGNILDGNKHNYTITFPPGKLPEAKYFWSFTMYDLPNRFLIKNPINRYSIGSLHKDLKQEKDGSTIIYFQSLSPGKQRESNWLPCPNAPFYTILRIYGPGEEVLSGKYTFPQILAHPKSE